MGGLCSVKSRLHPTDPISESSFNLYTTPPRKSLKTIVYVSRMVPGYFDDPGHMDSLIRFASANNKKMSMSGYLIVAPPFFLQRLEGPSERLDALMEGIKRDHRHSNLILIEERNVAFRSYENWTMRSYDVARSTDDNFEAIAYVMQALSKALVVARTNVYPPLFDKVIAGQELVLKNEMRRMVVVTISLGEFVVCKDRDGSTLADVAFLCCMVSHLKDKICSLNPVGRGNITMFGGTAIQVAVEMSEACRNLENKVVRACVELASAQGQKPRGHICIVVHGGKVKIRHLALHDDLRKARLLYGEAIHRGFEAAAALLPGPHAVVVEDSIAQGLTDEFTLHPIGQSMHSVACPKPPRSGVQSLSGPGRLARSGEAAVHALMRSPAKEEPQAPAPPIRPYSGPMAGNASCMSESDELDLEWMYQLENLSRVFKRRRDKRKIPLPPPSPTLSSNRTFTMANMGVLNLIYLSTENENAPFTPAEIQALGEASAKANALRGITGFLIFVRPYFLQYLEGPPAAVKDLFAKIRIDPRHNNIMLMTSCVFSDGARHFEHWHMKTTSLDQSDAEEVGPLRECLRLLSRHIRLLQAWLPRLQHDILLASVAPPPGAFVQCELVAFALLPSPASKTDCLLPPVLESLLDFLAQGGELVGFLGAHLVGYIFSTSKAVLIEKMAELCADYKVHVGIAAGKMLLLNAGLPDGPCDLGLYGSLFLRAQTLADQAATRRLSIVADPVCELNLPGVTWESDQTIIVGRMG